MVQRIFDTQEDDRRADDPWLSEFSVIDPSIAPDRVDADGGAEQVIDLPSTPEPRQVVELPPPSPEPQSHYDPYGDEEQFDGYETVVSEPWLPEPPQAPPLVETPFAPLPYDTESPAETARRSGMAWSIGIMFFSSVAFMLLLGWGADLILGTSPWGLVGGIVLGSLIGFVQFFRTSSKLFPGREPITEVKPLLSDPHDKD
jgi:hypothetical protein